MPSPLALVLDDDPAIRERARQALKQEGIDALDVASPVEAHEILKTHPHAVVVAVLDGAGAMVAQLARLRQEDGARVRQIQGRSDPSSALRRRVEDLAGTAGPVLFAGEAGSGRRYSAQCLHELSGGSRFEVLDPADRAAFDAALRGDAATVFVASLETLAWPVQEALAASLAAKRVRPRLTASIGADPQAAADEGRLSPALLLAFAGAIVRVPPLRERRGDVAMLARSFVEEVRRLNGLPAIAFAPDALRALEAHAWPGNADELRNAVESAVIVARDGTIRAADLPGVVGARDGAAALPGGAGADRRFRDAKRTVVEAFERAYLEDLLKRHGGNVTGAAETSGMLRSALQRLLRKHALHSADFRSRAPGPNGT